MSIPAEIPGRSDDVAVVDDESVIAADIDGGVEFGEQWSANGDRRAVGEQAGSSGCR